MEEAEADLRERVGLNATSTATIGGAWDNTRVQQLASKVPVTRLVLQAAESLLELLSNLFLVLLFTLYLLLGGGGAESHGVNAEADAQVLSYIKGKVLISLGVGVATALILLAVGLDLWLVFGVMAFWLNFIPNVRSSPYCCRCPSLSTRPSPPAPSSSRSASRSACTRSRATSSSRSSSATRWSSRPSPSCSR